MSTLDVRGKRHRSALVVVVAVVVVGVATVLAVTGGHRQVRVAQAVSAGFAAPASRGVAGSETAAGAAAAVTVIVAEEPLLVEGSAAGADALVGSWATSSSRAGLQAGFASARASFAVAKDGSLGFETALLAVRVSELRAGRATVDAWCAEVVFAQDAPVSAAYVTEHLALVWNARRWMVASITDTAGPSVALAGEATPAAEAAAALSGYQPPAAVTGPVDGIAGGR